MITTKLKNKVVTYIKHKDVVLKLIQNKGVVVNNSKLPVTCHYCELKWEQF